MNLMAVNDLKQSLVAGLSVSALRRLPSLHYFGHNRIAVI